MAALDLPLARYRLDFTVETPLHLPAYAGSTLRGAFGGALRAASCVTQQKTCDGCPLPAACPHAQIFETRPPADGHALQNFSHLPHPYVIEPPQWGERNYAPGETLSFRIVLAGRALEQLPLIVWSFVRGFARGVGRGDGTAQLARVVHAGTEETVVLDSPEGQIISHATNAPPMPDGITSGVILHFTSPLRLQTGGRRATADEYTPRRLLAALVRRIALIHEFHGNGPLALDFSDLARRAEEIASEKDLHWRDWTRYSSRQQQKMTLGGVIGSWRLEGEIAPFLPFLHLGQWLHVGKEATFGMGGYRMEAA